MGVYYARSRVSGKLFWQRLGRDKFDEALKGTFRRLSQEFPVIHRRVWFF